MARYPSGVSVFPSGFFRPACVTPASSALNNYPGRRSHQKPPHVRQDPQLPPIAHAIYRVVWTQSWSQGVDGRGMLNYANLATAPIDNFIAEFLPDVARRIHVRVVLVQHII